MFDTRTSERPHKRAAYDSVSKRAGSKVITAVALALGALALGTAQAQAQAPLSALERLDPAAARAQTNLFPLLKVKGTNGYRITVVGLGVDGELTLAAQKGKASKFAVATYTVLGEVTAKRMKGRFGRFGKIDVRFVKKGKVRKRLPRRCTGKPDKIQRGIWKGVVRFKGRRGFTKVKVRSARGSVTRFGDYTCNPGGGGGGENIIMLDARKETPKRRIDFTVAQADRPGARPQFSASRHLRIGKVELMESAFRRGRPSQFRFTAPEPTGDADVSPKSPFSGSARYRAGDWSGNLKVKLPGGPAKLTGPGFTAELDLFGLA